MDLLTNLKTVLKSVGLTIGIVAFAATVHAQSNYPSKPIKIVVPFGTGSVSDLLGRIIAQNLSQEFDQAVIVDNQSGAGGNIGTGYVAAAEPDGYTLLLGATSTNAVNPSLFKNLRYDAVNDFAPITNLASVANVLVVHPDVRCLSSKMSVFSGRVL